MKCMIILSLFCLILLYINAYSMTLSKFSLQQSLNIPAIKMIGKICSSPSLARPCLEINALSELNLQFLKDRGIKCLVFDKDNTLCNTYTDELHPRVVVKMNEVNCVFPKHSVAILSNSVGTTDDINYDGAKLTESKLNIPVIRHKQKKPGCIDEVIEHFKPSIPNIQPKDICMIGDRLLTDVVFANQHNMYSVLVKPLDNTKDHPVAVIMRTIELSCILPFLKFCGVNRPQR